MPRQYHFAVYFLMNENKTVIYNGFTNNLARRLVEHYQGAQQRSSKAFTARYNCYYLVGYESYQYVYDAMAREDEIKGWRREKKMALILSLNPELRFMNDEILGVGWEEMYRVKRR
jgi:putative endonuclease